MTARRRGCSSAMDAIPWKRCSLMSPAVPTRREPRSEQAHEAQYRIRNLALHDFLATDRRHDRALLVSSAFIMAAAPRTGVLADSADAGVGLPAALYRAERRIFCAGRRHFYRCSAVVGHSAPRPARVFDIFPGGDVVTQSCQSDDKPSQ